MIETRESFCALETQIHPEKEVSGAIDRGDHESIVIRETIGQLALERRWSEVWEIADSMSREVSVLFDADGRIWVDIGTAGHVSLEPPLGATIPFRLWVHTHPWDPYWSQTDKDTLAAYATILESALVLGHDRMKWSRNGSEMQTIEPSGPLSTWSSEPCVHYEDGRSENQ